MKYIFCLLFAGFILMGCKNTVASSNMEAEGNHMSKELIVLASPPNGDTYYADVLDDIFDFHVAYVKQIRRYDNVIILTGEDFYDDYVHELGAEFVLKHPMEDIWMRDFTLSNATRPLMFRYTSEGQGGGRRGQEDADAVQERFATLLDKADVKYTDTELFNDGGNWVDDYAGRIVVSRKFLRDNHLTESKGRTVLQDLSGATHIAFIEADEQGGLEHADGVVAFVAENTLVINSYPEDPAYAETLKSDLRRGLPGVQIYEIITPYDGSQIYDSRFGSACGLYTNMLVTPERIYFPQFGIPEDAQALAQLRQWTDRDIVPVHSGQVCSMGGGVRCMSWQVRGTAAEKLLHYTKRMQK